MSKNNKVKIHFEDDAKLANNIETIKVLVESEDDEKAVKCIIAMLLGYPSTHSNELHVWNLMAKSTLVGVLEKFLSTESDVQKKWYLQKAIENNYLSLARLILDKKPGWKISDFDFQLKQAEICGYQQMIDLVKERFKN